MSKKIKLPRKLPVSGCNKRTLDKLAGMIKSSRDPWGDKDSLEKTKKRQGRIEVKVRKLSWGETEAEKDRFVKTIHQFFSPIMVPDGLTDGEARLIYIIASTFANARINMGPLPMEWEVEKMTRDSFWKGLRSFTNANLSRADGEINSEGNVSIFSFSPPKKIW